MAKEFIVLVGNVGTGKTTYCNEHFSEGYEIVRPDDWEPMSRDELSSKYNKLLIELTDKGKSIVIDGVNAWSKGRKMNLGFQYNKGYKTIAIDFGSGDDDTLQRRLHEPRMDSAEVIRSLHIRIQAQYETPKKEEGFDEIITI